MSLQPGNGGLAEKHAKDEPALLGDGHFSSDPEMMVGANENMLHQDLKGRHMQMIAMQVPAR
jgi:amino acid transporter